jgi:uncharacterized protein YdaU (DUF1376 family)
MPFYVKEFLADEAVQLMDLDEVGAYTLLLLHQWTHGSVPSDIAALGKICKNTKAGPMRRIWRAMADKFPATSGDPNRLQNQKLERVRAEQEAFLENRRASGKAGGIRSAEVRRRSSTASSTAASSAPVLLEAKPNAAVAVAVAVPLSKERGSRDSAVEQIGDVAGRVLPRLQSERVAS